MIYQQYTVTTKYSSLTLSNKCRTYFPKFQSRILRCHDRAHDRNARRADRAAGWGVLPGNAAEGKNGNRQLRSDARHPFKADRRPIARLAGTGEDRTEGDVVGAGGRCKTRGGQIVCGLAQQRPWTQTSARGSDITVTRQMQTLHQSGRFKIVMDRQGGTEFLSDRSQSLQQITPCVGIQVLLPQADPATAPLQCGQKHRFERSRGLPSIGDQQHRRDRQIHVPIRPNCGLEGSA